MENFLCFVSEKNFHSSIVMDFSSFFFIFFCTRSFFFLSFHLFCVCSRLSMIFNPKPKSAPAKKKQQANCEKIFEFSWAFIASCWFGKIRKRWKVCWMHEECFWKYFLDICWIRFIIYLIVCRQDNHEYFMMFRCNKSDTALGKICWITKNESINFQFSWVF